NNATISAVERVVEELPLPMRLSPTPLSAETPEDLRKLLLPHLAGAPSSQESPHITLRSLIDKLVKILIELLSSNGCNCLRGGGTARLFDLEYFSPLSVANRSGGPPSGG